MLGIFQCVTFHSKFQPSILSLLHCFKDSFIMMQIHRNLSFGKKRVTAKVEKKPGVLARNESFI